MSRLRQFKATFGVSSEEFETIFQVFEPLWEAKRQAKQAARWQNKVRKKKAGSGKKPNLPTARICLGFLLVYYKQYPTFDAFGAQFNMSGSSANKLFHEHRLTLYEALVELEVVPPSKFESVTDFHEFLENNNLEVLLIDVTEQAIQRPENSDIQAASFSGKKKRNTVKNTIIATPQKAVVFVSLTQWGKIHDFEQLKQNFAVGQNWFEGVKTLVDLGYLGFDKKYPNSDVDIPKRRKPRRGKNLLLTEQELFPQQDKEFNTILSKRRVFVENAISGLKRFFCLVHRWRNHLSNFHDDAILTIAGLWNLKLNKKIIL